MMYSPTFIIWINHYCRWIYHTWILMLVEEILHQLRLVVYSIIYNLQGYVHPRWCRISSVNSMELGWIEDFLTIRVQLSPMIPDNKWDWCNCLRYEGEVCEGHPTCFVYFWPSCWKLPGFLSVKNKSLKQLQVLGAEMVFPWWDKV